MSSLGIFNKETKTYQKVAGTAEAAVVDAEMSDTSTNTVQNKVIKKYVDDSNTTKLDKTSVVDNQLTSEAGYALDARQANPNVDGSLGAQIKALNDILNSKKVPTFECNDSIFENSCFIVPITDGDIDLITSTTDWDENNGGHRIHFMNKQSAETSFSTNIKVPAHSVVLIDLMSLNKETIVVTSNTLFYNNTDNEVTEFIQCYIKHSMVNATCTINMYPIIIKNI